MTPNWTNSAPPLCRPVPPDRAARVMASQAARVETLSFCHTQQGPTAYPQNLRFRDSDLTGFLAHPPSKGTARRFFQKRTRNTSRIRLIFPALGLRVSTFQKRLFMEQLRATGLYERVSLAGRVGRTAASLKCWRLRWIAPISSRTDSLIPIQSHATSLWPRLCHWRSR